MRTMEAPLSLKTLGALDWHPIETVQSAGETKLPLPKVAQQIWAERESQLRPSNSNPVQPLLLIPWSLCVLFQASSN